MNALLTSREFWVTLFTLAVLIIGQFMPGFKMDIESAAALVVIVVMYLVGIAVDPGPGGWKGVIQSRKFWTAFVGAVLVFLDAFGVILPEGLSLETLVTIVALTGGLIANFAIKGPPLPAGDVIDAAHKPTDETGQS